MDREVARRRAEVMLAFANGCDVQFYNGVTKQWEDIAAECVGFDSQTKYRVKSLPKYRPFRTQEECWQEMHKHPDFGWLKSKPSVPIYFKITVIDYDVIGINGQNISCKKCFDLFTFTDGEPFGIKEK